MISDCIFLFLIFVTGLSFGSFFNVCIYRMPKSLSILKPKSYCPSCKNNLKWYHNVPLLSFIFLKRRCAFCKESISRRYFFVELLTGILFALTFILNDFWFDFNLLFKLVFVSYAVIISFIDIYHKIILDRFSLSLIVLGVLYNVVEGDWLFSIISAFIGFSFFFSISWIYFKLKNKMGLGGGDIKLIAGIGAFLGLKGLFFVLIVSSFLGIITILCYPPLLKKEIPFGPFLLGASLVYIYWGNFFINIYLNWAFAY